MQSTAWDPPPLPEERSTSLHPDFVSAYERWLTTRSDLPDEMGGLDQTWLWLSRLTSHVRDKIVLWAVHGSTPWQFDIPLQESVREVREWLAEDIAADDEAEIARPLDAYAAALAAVATAYEQHADPTPRRYACPVCGYVTLTVKPFATWPPPEGLVLAPPYWRQLGTASYEVCVRCCFEFGNDDDPGGGVPGESFASYRAIWEAQGRPWMSPLYEHGYRGPVPGQGA